VLGANLEGALGAQGGNELAESRQLAGHLLCSKEFISEDELDQSRHALSRSYE
jgi:hypothetical protein